MSELSRPKYLALLERQRDGIDAIANGLREYLIADIESEIEAIESQPIPDREAVVARLTEDLMAASAQASMIETQVQNIQETLNGLDAGTLEMLKPFEPMLNGVLLPLLQQSYAKATRRRDDIQAELMEYETPEAQA
jgi:hypothetical protein